jgi:prevent-host-death family protein
MTVMNIHEAKTHFSKLIGLVLAGEEVIIAKAGKPTIRLLPILDLKPKRQPGRLKGKIKISADFNAPLPESILRDFESE